MLCKTLILGLGMLIILQQSEGMFNTGGKHSSGPIMQKSCSNMSSLFDKMGKTLAKISAHIDIVNFNDKIDEKKGDITSLIVSFQGYKGLFDQFGSSVTSTSATSATPLSLMTTISAKLTSLNTIASTVATALQSLDASFGTVLYVSAPSFDAQAGFTTLVSQLFTALQTLISFKTVTDAQLSSALSSVDVAGLVSFLAGFEVSLAKLLVQLNYIESQFATIEDYQKAIKKAADSFITGIAKVTKTCRDNQDKGKKVWKDALDKEYNDQKTAGDKVKKALLANANVDQFAAANAAITKLNAFYSEFALSVYATDAGFLLMLSGQYDYALQVEMDLSNYESPMIIDHVTLIGQSLFQNVNGKGQSCLKNMTEQFTSTFKSFEAMQGSCFEDLTTYLAFSTEFVTTQLPLVKCQGTGVVNYLPSCLKQVSQKTSKTYADAMYNTCLANFVGYLETGYDAGLGFTVNALGDQVTNDKQFIETIYESCAADAATKLTASVLILTNLFAACSPAPVS